MKLVFYPFVRRQPSRGGDYPPKTTITTLSTMLLRLTVALVLLSAVMVTASPAPSNLGKADVSRGEADDVHYSIAGAPKLYGE